MLTMSNEMRREADRLLEDGLMALLARHGEVHVVGSYALRLMTWRDLDIHLVREDASTSAFFALGGALAALLQPHRMQFRDDSR